MATRVRKPTPARPTEGAGARYEDYMAGAMHFLDYAHNRLEQQLAMLVGEERDKLLTKKKWLEETIRIVERESITKKQITTKKPSKTKRL